MKRKMVAFISAAALLTALLAGCGGTAVNTPGTRFRGTRTGGGTSHSGA